MIGRVFAFAALLLLGIVGLGMSLCGGFFLLGSLFGGGGEMAGMIVIAGPALALGLAALWGAKKGFAKMRAGRNAPTPPDA